MFGMINDFIVEHWCIIVALVFIAFDILTGVIKAAKNGELSSTVARQGLFNKTGFVLVIVFGCLCEYGSNLVDFGFEVPLILPTCIYIVMLEALSIIENLCDISPDLAKYLVKFISTEGK